MMKFEHTKVMNWEAAIRGMRNPLESWDKSDSRYDGIRYLFYADPEVECFTDGEGSDYVVSDVAVLGKNDLSLMKRLRKAGTDHRKFMRQIVVSVDITAPLYWWKEFDTYKVGTVANSCSTMHCIHKKPFDVSDFAHDWLIGFDEPKDSFTIFEKGLYNPEDQTYWAASNLLMFTIRMLNFYRERYLETKDKLFWYQMIQLLPESYLQKRTITFNYEVLANIARSRRDHKLDEWSVEFMDWMRGLPYAEDLIFETEKG